MVRSSMSPGAPGRARGKTQTTGAQSVGAGRDAAQRPLHTSRPWPSRTLAAPPQRPERDPSVGRARERARRTDGLPAWLVGSLVDRALARAQCRCGARAQQDEAQRSAARRHASGGGGRDNGRARAKTRPSPRSAPRPPRRAPRAPPLFPAPSPSAESDTICRPRHAADPHGSAVPGPGSRPYPV
eukprot:scaffold3100_cov403-Prasinococcus_capsulatus_cf.AAC.7